MCTLAAAQETRPYKVFRELEGAVAPFRKSLKRFTIIHTGLIGAKEYLTGAIDENQYCWIAAVKLISGLVFVFSIPKLIISMQLATCAKSQVERIEQVANALITAGVMTGSCATCIEALKGLNYLSSTSFTWTPIVSSLFLPLQVVSLELNAAKIAESYTIKNRLLTALPSLKRNVNRTQQVKDLTEACSYIIENKKNIEKSLEISKKEQLDERAKVILQGIHEKNNSRLNSALDDGIHFLEVLKARACTKHNLSIAAGVSKALALAASTVSLIFLSVATGWIAMASVACVSFTVIVTEKLLMHKYPFSQRAPAPIRDCEKI